MPGYVLDSTRIIMVLGTTFIGAVWFLLYFACLYKSDRGEDLEHWKHRLLRRKTTDDFKRLAEEKKEQVAADMVLVFHHPDYEYSDKYDAVTQAALERCFVSHQLTHMPKHLAQELGFGRSNKKPALGRQTTLKSLGENDYNDMNEDDSEEEMGASPSCQPESPHHAPTTATSGEAFESSDESESGQPEGHQLRSMRVVRNVTRHMEKTTATMGATRFALMRDVYVNLQEMGFDVQIKVSLDGDELFMCVNLAKEKAVEHYMLKNGLRFQLQPYLIQKLGIEQPADENASSPPSMPYNPRDVQMLYEAKFIETNDPRELYKVDKQHHHVNVSKSSDRIHCIYKEISTVFDLDALAEQGFLVDWFPGHDPRKSLHKLGAVWSHHDLLADITIRQPIVKIKNYFGTRIAFNFAWTGTYTKCLLALLPFAASVALSVAVMKFAGYQVKELTDRRILAFSITLAVWSRIAHNTWMREFGFFNILFANEESAAQSQSDDVCPEFHGTPEPSPVDMSKLELQYPKWKYMLRQFVSSTFTIAYSFFVASMVMAFMHRSVDGNGGVLSLWANLYLVANIKIFQIIYDFLAIHLTKWENHKYHHDFYNSHLWKQVFFQFVNYYMPFFYLVGHQRQTGLCPEIGCLVMLQNSLNCTLLILGGCRVFQIGFYHMVTAYKLSSESARIDSALNSARRTLNDFSPRSPRRHTEQESDAAARLEGQFGEREASGVSMASQEAAPIPKKQHHSWIETQAKYPGYQINEQIETMLELVLALGYVLIFGSVAFGTVLWCFAVFFIQLRANAYFLTSNARRPLPRESIGIGAWRDVVDTLMKIGVLFEGFLIVTFDQSFQGTEAITKLMGIVIFWCICATAWYIVDFILPTPDAETVLLKKRRAYTLRKFSRKTGHLVSANRDNCNWGEPTELHRGDVEHFTHFDGSRVAQLPNA
jgi:hypothetical protein